MSDVVFYVQVFVPPNRVKEYNTLGKPLLIRYIAIPLEV